MTMPSRYYVLDEDRYMVDLIDASNLTEAKEALRQKYGKRAGKLTLDRDTTRLTREERDAERRARRAKPNRVSYGSKYAVQIRVPRKAPKQVVCEFAWQADDVAEREKKSVDNMVHGTVIIRTRHALPMQRWEFDGEDVRWHSVYARNSSKGTQLTDAQRKILVKLDEDLADLGFPDQVEDLLSGGWDDSVDSYLRAGKSDVWNFHFRHVGEEEDRPIYEQAERLWDDARKKVRELPTANGRRYVLVDYEFDRSKGKYKEESTAPVALEEFFDANAETDEVMDEEKKIRSLPVGGEVRFGGGAAPLTAIRRVS